jgi:hypothetical protein
MHKKQINPKTKRKWNIILPEEKEEEKRDYCPSCHKPSEIKIVKKYYYEPYYITPYFPFLPSIPSSLPLNTRVVDPSCLYACTLRSDTFYPGACLSICSSPL